MTRDPLGEAGGLNLYGFVGNGPMNYMDPYGLSDFSITRDEWYAMGQDERNAWYAGYQAAVNAGMRVGMDPHNYTPPYEEVSLTLPEVSLPSTDECMKYTQAHGEAFRDYMQHYGEKYTDWATDQMENGGRKAIAKNANQLTGQFKYMIMDAPPPLSSNIPALGRSFNPPPDYKTDCHVCDR